MIAQLIAIAILSSPAPVPTSYGVVECSGWPLSRGQLHASGIRVVRVHQRPGRVLVRLDRPATRQRANLVAFRLGSREAGWTVWSVRGPTVVLQMIASSPKCRNALTYKQVRQLPTAWRNWIAERSTCYGSATWRGRAFTVWPCVWSTSRAGQGSISNLAGIGPGILAGGSGLEAAGVTSE